MKICVISSIDEKVPPDFYGGIGRIVGILADGLIGRGHDVTLLASGDSKTVARLCPIIPKSIGANNPKNVSKVRETFFQMAIAEILEILLKENFDIISNHFGWRLVPFGKLLSSPLITTLHTPLDQINKKVIFSAYKKIPVISISDSQRKALPDLNYLKTIYNGIDISLFNFSDTHEDYLAFLGRMSPEKGPGEAIQIATKLGIKLIMAAAIHDWDRHYFESKIKQYIDNKKIVFIGEINDKQKNKLLGGAKALLAPIRWEEPFGLTFIEAMACGTPVVAFNRGAVKEIIVDGKTGIIANSIAEVCSRFKEINRIKRIDCRRHVEKKFSSIEMVDNYEKAYLEYLKNIHAKTQ